MPKARRLIWNVLALLLGFFGGGYLHYYAMVSLQEHTDLQLYSWNDPWQGAVLRVTFFGDFAIGVVLVVLATVLIVRRGFSVQLSLLLGFGASVMGYTLLGIVLCMFRC
jgi:hypothetical protein